MKDKKIIVALDVQDLNEAGKLVDALVGRVAFFKVGLGLVTAAGSSQAVACVKSRGGEVFYDGKFHDIPHTVGEASRELSKLGVRAFSVHASGWRESVREAVRNKGESMVWGVTVLTSLAEGDCMQIYGAKPDKKVIQFAEVLAEEGADGIVCSGQEALMIRSHAVFDHMTIATPGVRPLWAVRADQKRVMTPAEAVKTGVDYLIIGRPILDPPVEIGSPLEAVERINKEIESAS